MHPSDRPEIADGGEDQEFDRLEAKSRRFLIVALLAIVSVVVASAWFVGGTQGFEQIGQGGVNTSLLPRVGDPAPDVTVSLIDQEGRQIERVRLSDFRGQPVWLNFWGSWCPPCRAEMPDIQAAYAEELRPRGLVWLAVSLNEPAANAASFAALNDVTFLIASDPNRTDTGAAYPIANFPTHILIDEEGTIRDVVLAAIDKEEIINRAEKILLGSE